MSDGEQLVAEQVVAMQQSHALKVRISQHAVEDFWRVDVSSDQKSSAAPAHHTSTTVGPGDSFMMNLIQGAVSGEQVAWRHLAQWGRDSFSGPARPQWIR